MRGKWTAPLFLLWVLAMSTLALCAVTLDHQIRAIAEEPMH